MSFTRTHVTGRDSKIDDQAADHEVRMVVFDFESMSSIVIFYLHPDLMLACRGHARDDP